ncbi:MAG: hypothetical protein CMP20_04645 [Rickettsiales bacterium]|nr:hypothetical protein [Rickettsiales bacterium]
MTKKPVKTQALRRSKRAHKRVSGGLKRRFRDAYLEVYGWVGRNSTMLSNLFKNRNQSGHTQPFKVPETWLHYHYVAFSRQLQTFANQVLSEPHSVNATFTPSHHLASVKCRLSNGMEVQEIDADTFVDQLWP